MLRCGPIYWLQLTVVACATFAAPMAAAAAKANSELHQELLQLGFAPEMQNHSCVAPMYFTEISDGHLVARMAKATDPRFQWNTMLSFSGKNVRYEAENHGEFGGQLNAIFRSGERRKIIEGNVRALVPVDGDLYVFEGLSHLTSSTGSMHLVRNFDRNPAPPTLVTLLPDAPIYAQRQTTIRNMRIFWVVGGHSLARVAPEAQMLDIVSLNEFSIGALSSLAEDERGLVIGVCGGVIVLNSSCYKDHFLPEGKSCAAQYYAPRRDLQ